jgi:hypothetical protein
MRKRIVTNALSAWRTPEGIGLGSSEEDVLKAHGTPSAEKKLKQKPTLEIKGHCRVSSGDNQPRIGDKVIIFIRAISGRRLWATRWKMSYIWLKIVIFG